MVKSYPMGHPKTTKKVFEFFVCNLLRQICQSAISLKLLVYDSFGSVYRFLQVRKWGIGQRIIPLSHSGAEIQTISICLYLVIVHIWA